MRVPDLTKNARFYLVFGQTRTNHLRIRIPGWLCTWTFIAIVARFGWSTLAITEDWP